MTPDANWWVEHMLRHLDPYPIEIMMTVIGLVSPCVSHYSILYVGQHLHVQWCKYSMWICFLFFNFYFNDFYQYIGLITLLIHTVIFLSKFKNRIKAELFIIWKFISAVFFFFYIFNAFCFKPIVIYSQYKNIKDGNFNISYIILLFYETFQGANDNNINFFLHFWHAACNYIYIFIFIKLFLPCFVYTFHNITNPKHCSSISLYNNISNITPQLQIIYIYTYLYRPIYYWEYNIEQAQIFFII